ncbi:MAG: hypothetical protein R3D67_18470 [Hyphomicrobiaceae bacterium]
MELSVDTAQLMATQAHRGKLASCLVAIGQGVMAMALITCLVAGGYVVKSALGIDLLPGPSPLHNLLYPLVARL